MSEQIYINPANIFLIRDFFDITASKHGAISIQVEGGSGWMARKIGSFESLVSGLDVWQMCRWLNEHNVTVEKR